ncbi:PaaI family thioesterase [Saccharopolyspora sp. NPDC050642]|uniref:PaaI family thioesterase n=1 Tax=Saccharopolyspora sp. NPDC050642 TaxID=3157099 RepID=UPI003410A451
MGRRVMAGLTASDVEELLRAAPYHQWLDLRVVELTKDRIELTARWREEWVGNHETRATHGGILASLLDLAADWALTGTIGRGVPTVDLTVNYLRAALPGDLRVIGRLIRPGRQVSVAEAEVLDQDGRTVAIGRGAFLSAAVQ